MFTVADLLDELYVFRMDMPVAVGFKDADGYVLAKDLVRVKAMDGKEVMEKFGADFGAKRVLMLTTFGGDEVVEQA